MLRLAAAALREALRAPGAAARHEPRPPAAGLVLEVGSGQRAHPRADVVVDLYVVDATEREGELELTKPLVVADGHRLPFRDGTFAYVLALHVLEHAEDPAAFASELARVARAGFVQTPSAFAERTFGWPFHRWEVERHEGGLAFRPRRGAPADGARFHRLHADSALFRLFWAAHRDLFLNSVEWTGSLPIVVDGAPAPETAAAFDEDATLAALERLGAAGHLPPLPRAVRDALACPRCRGELTLSETDAECSACPRRYPVRSGVPVLVDGYGSR